MSVETLGGIKTLKLNAAGGRVQTVRVDMGQPATVALRDSHARREDECRG